MGRRKTICVYVDAELVEEAVKAAEAQGASLSGLVEEALRLYVLYVLRRPEPQARARRAGRKPPAGSPRREATPADSPRESSPQGGASAALQDVPQAQLPPHLRNNAWIAMLRSRR